jgi:hypothetical protein
MRGTELFFSSRRFKESEARLSSDEVSARSPQSDDTGGYPWQSGAQAGYGDWRTLQPAFSTVNHAPI